MKHLIPLSLIAVTFVTAMVINLYGSKTDVSVYPHSVVFHAKGNPSILNIEGKASSICKGEATTHSGSVTCDMTHFDTGISLRDKHLRGYIRADDNPEATLSYSSSKPGEFKGILKFAGHEKKVSGTISPKQDPEQGALEPLVLKFQIDIRDFEIADPNFKGVGILPTIDIVATVNRVRVSKSDNARIRVVSGVSPEPAGQRLSY